jgi:RNA polymerase-binding transcription factor DksA
MAKKKVTKKKINKKPASKVSKKTSKRSPAPKTKKKTSKKKTTKKPAAKKKKAPAKKKVTKKKVTKKTPKKVLMKVSKKVAPKPAKKVTKKTAKGKRSAKRPAPDANGYVIINGRRVRMMAVAAEPVTTPVKRTRKAKSTPEPEPANKTRKPVKTKLSKKDLDHYRSLLLLKRAELVGDLSAMEAQALRANGGQGSHMPIHMADVGSDNFDQDFMLGMAENERQRLREIDAALKRIEDKIYGVCQMTEKVIPKSRLNAKPWARYTIEAARQIERGHGE